jgi:phage tail protein X
MQYDAITKYNTAVNEPVQTPIVGEMAEGMVGDVIPTAFFYIPVASANGSSPFRYWTKFVVAVPDMQGNREQDVWYRFQQIECSGPQMKPPCTLHPNTVMYWDTYWFSNYPGANKSDTQRQTLKTGPVRPASASGFYRTLLENRRWWAAELANEGMHELSLPSPNTTNGTWLATQATRAIVKSMITRESTWHPRAGVSPGYGSVVYDGLQEVFVSTAMAALEVGAMPYAQGLIDNQFRYYVREDGMIWHGAEELAAQARMLTILALYHSYSAGDGAFLLQHFDKAKALADLLVARHAASLRYGEADPRYGIPAGGDDATSAGHSSIQVGDALHGKRPRHFYASAAELYRACTELGEVWSAIGTARHRADVAAHGAELSALALQIRAQLSVSLNRTMGTAGSGTRCWRATADEPSSTSNPRPTPSFRGFAEMLYSGALTTQQVSDIYAASSDSVCGARLLILGSPALQQCTSTVCASSTLWAPTAYGLAYGLLQHDMVEPFLLHYFAMSAHAYTRGSAMAPEWSDLANRDIPATAYAAASEVIAPAYLKWMLCFEEPETRTLWLAKATPRDWLAAGQASPVRASNLTTRYGRVSFTITAPAAAAAAGLADEQVPFSVHASITLPASFATAATAPAGGIRLRIRTPMEHAGKLSGVTVGGQAWSDFDAAEETVNIAASKITASLISEGLPHIVATFA